LVTLPYIPIGGDILHSLARFDNVTLHILGGDILHSLARL